MSAYWLRRCATAVACGVVFILAGCGGAGRGHLGGGASTSSTARRTAPSAETTTTATQALKTLRCPHEVSLPSRGKYAGQSATVFIVNTGPKRSGCSFATGWIGDWITAGASPGGYAIGRFGGIRCDEPFLGSTLSKAVTKELGRDGVQPDTVTCPALARKLGATATCKISGTDLDVGSARLHGTAQVTVQDRAGHRALDSFQLNGAHGKGVRGTGYPFDPETGRVL